MWLFAFSRFLIWCLPRRTSWDGRPIGTTAGIGLLASEGKVYAQLSCLVSLCRPGCPGTCRNMPVTASWVLGVKVCTPTPSPCGTLLKINKLPAGGNCFCWGPKFNSQYPHQVWELNCLKLHLQGADTSLFPWVHTHKQIIKIKRKPLYVRVRF